MIFWIIFILIHNNISLSLFPLLLCIVFPFSILLNFILRLILCLVRADLRPPVMFRYVLHVSCLLTVYDTGFIFWILVLYLHILLNPFVNTQLQSSYQPSIFHHYQLSIPKTRDHSLNTKTSAETNYLKVNQRLYAEHLIPVNHWVHLLMKNLFLSPNRWDSPLIRWRQLCYRYNYTVLC